MFKQIHEDNRGKVYLLEYKGKEFLLLETNAGSARGGDVHKSTQYDIVLSGEIFWIKRMKKCGKKSFEILSEGDMTSTKAGVSHFMVSFSDSLVLEWLDEAEGPKKTYDTEFREIVNSINEMRKL